jgi:proteasome accessory factor B
VLTDTAEPSPQDAGTVALEELRSVWALQVATLHVAPGSDAHTALVAKRASPSASDTLLVHYTDRDIFAEEIVSWGKEVQVLEPEDLRARVRELLQVLVKTHG